MTKASAVIYPTGKDDSDALTAGLAANDGVVILSRGVFRFGKTVILPNGFHIRGQGIGHTFVQCFRAGLLVCNDVQGIFENISFLKKETNLDQG